jgi:hypothetical protein
MSGFRDFLLLISRGREALKQRDRRKIMLRYHTWLIRESRVDEERKRVSWKLQISPFCFGRTNNHAHVRFRFCVIHTRLKLQKRKVHFGFVVRFFQCRIIRVVRQNNTQHLVLPLSVLYSIYREPKLLMPSVPSDFSEQQRRRQAETGT